VFFAALSKEDHVQGGVRPVLIVQNNMGNMHSPVVSILPVSSKTQKASHLPVHVYVRADDNNGLKCDSVVLVEQPRTIPVNDLIGRIGSLAHEDLVRVGKAVEIQSPYPKS